ncbi:MAG: hypothetical protein ABIZ07_04700 [Dermatophilaceae bacterium]
MATRIATVPMSVTLPAIPSESAFESDASWRLGAPPSLMATRRPLHRAQARSA